MHTKKSGGARKVGRNKSKCEMYKMLGKFKASHIKKIKKHLEVYGRNDKQAIDALDRYEKLR